MGLPKPKLPKIPNPVKAVQGAVENVKDKAGDLKDKVVDTARGATSWVQDNWRTLAVIGVGVLVTAAILAAVVLSGGTLAPFALAGAAALLTAGGAGGLASYLAAGWLLGDPVTVRGAVAATVTGAVLTWAVPAGGSKLAPAVQKVAGPGAAKVVRVVTGAVDDARAPRGDFRAAGRSAVEVQDGVTEHAAAVRAAAPSKRQTPFITAGVPDERSGAIYYGTSQGGKPYSEAIHPDLAARVPDAGRRVIPTQPFENCAEFDAINKALHAGASWDDLGRPLAVVTKDGSSKPICANCELWVPTGARIVAPPSNVSRLPTIAGPATIPSATRGFLGALDGRGPR